MTEIITLSCPSCGGKLTIKPGVTNFACGYCGNEHVVHREGGIVTLEAIGENVQKIERSTDRTAIELTLVRLEKEIGNLKNKEQEDEHTVVDIKRTIDEKSAVLKLEWYDFILIMGMCLIAIFFILPIPGNNHYVGIYLMVAYIFFKIVGYFVRIEEAKRLLPSLKAAQVELHNTQHLRSRKEAERTRTLTKIYGASTTPTVNN